MMSTGDVDDRGALVGLWRLASAEHWADGVRVYPFGAAPIGSMLISADGAVSCQVARNEASSPSGEEELAIHERLFAVWGRWTISGEILVIDVLGSADPALVGVAQRRRYTVEAESLILEGSPAPNVVSSLSYAIRWTRV